MHALIDPTVQSPNASTDSTPPPLSSITSLTPDSSASKDEAVEDTGPGSGHESDESAASAAASSEVRRLPRRKSTPKPKGTRSAIAWTPPATPQPLFDTYRYFYPKKTGVFTYFDNKTLARTRNAGTRSSLSSVPCVVCFSSASVVTPKRLAHRLHQLLARAAAVRDGCGRGPRHARQRSLSGVV
jgi:hypothetical protein